jgi:hypothetical protein
MAYVYSNSHFNISADWSPDANDGCFKVFDVPQDLSSDKAFCVTNILSSGETSCLYFRCRTGDYQNLGSTHLASRAWAFQERALSRRNLHFTHDQLHWECREGFAGEDMIPRSNNGGHQYAASFLNSRSDEMDWCLFKWCVHIVGAYSRAIITYPTDRLPAISAMAKIFADQICSPYLAGLWLEGLWYTLSWYRIPHAGKYTVERPQQYTAPS